MTTHTTPREFSEVEKLCIRRLKAKCWKSHQIAERLGCTKEEIKRFLSTKEGKAPKVANPIDNPKHRALKDEWAICEDCGDTYPSRVDGVVKKCYCPSLL